MDIDDDSVHHVHIVDGDLKCAICQDYFVEPVCTSCGHHFCRACLLRWIGGENRTVPTCPECRQLFPFGFDKNFLRVTKPDIFVTNILKRKIYISCPNECGARLHPSLISIHLAECPLETVDCENHKHGCPVKVRRRSAEDHKAQCSYNPCEAAIVGCSFVGHPSHLEEHSNSCCLALLKKYIDQAISARVVPSVEDRQVAYNNPIFLPSGRSRAPGDNTTGVRRDLTHINRTGPRQTAPILSLPSVTGNRGVSNADGNEGRTGITDHSFINVSFRQLDNLEHFATSLSDMISQTAGNTHEN